MSDDTEKPPGEGPQQPAVDPRRAMAKLDFELGFSLKVIGAKVGVSGTAVAKWAEQGKWVRGASQRKQVAVTKAAERAARAPTPTPTPTTAPAPVPSTVVAIRPGIALPQVGEVGGLQCDANQQDHQPPTSDDNLGHDEPLDVQFRARVRQMLECPTRDEAVEVAAAAVVQVVMKQRKGASRMQRIVDGLAGQLEMAMETRDLIEQAICESTEPGKVRNALLRLVSLSSHAGTVRDLATASTKLASLERQTFGLGPLDVPLEDKPVTTEPVADAAFDAIRAKVKQLHGGKP